MAVVISVMATKGGVGKSTIANSLADLLAQPNDDRPGYQVLIIDADPQGSIGTLHRLRLNAGGEFHADLLAEVDPDAVAAVIRDSVHQVIIIDTPGYSDPWLAQAVASQSDMNLVVSEISSLSLEPALRLMDAIASWGKPSRLLINKVDPRGAADAYDEVQQFLQQREPRLQALDTYVRALPAVSAAQDRGEPVHTASDGAMRDFFALANSVINELN